MVNWGGGGGGLGMDHLVDGLQRWRAFHRSQLKLTIRRQCHTLLKSPVQIILHLLPREVTERAQIVQVTGTGFIVVIDIKGVTIYDERLTMPTHGARGLSHLPNQGEFQ